jgi:hypothetical protein
LGFGPCLHPSPYSLPSEDMTEQEVYDWIWDQEQLREDVVNAVTLTEAVGMVSTALGNAGLYHTTTLQNVEKAVSQLRKDYSD